MFDWLQRLADWLVYDSLGISKEAHLGQALNFFIYTRLKVSRLRNQEPDRSIFWIYKQILKKDVADASSRSKPSRGRNSNNTTGSKY